MVVDFSDKYLFYNNSLVLRAGMDTSNKGSKTIYEVLRVISGSALFINDHLQRLQASLSSSDIAYQTITIDKIHELISTLCAKNDKYFGNIEYRVTIDNDGSIHQYMGFIPHYYPEAVHYIEGIKTNYISAIRENPEIKAKFTSTREKANTYIVENNLYEVLLANDEGFLTEGSRSNLFFIKGNTVYTAPDELVLGGITRLKVIQLLKRMNSEFKYKAISVYDIHKFDAAFLCGTSPGVLPISSIGAVEYDVKNAFLRSIISQHNDQISNYITKSID